MRPIVRKMKTCESPANLRRWINGMRLIGKGHSGEANICNEKDSCQYCIFNAPKARPITITIEDGHGEES